MSAHPRSDSGEVAGSSASPGDDMDEDEDPDVVDSCLEFMGNYVTKSLRIKYDKWQKLVTSDEYKVRKQKTRQNHHISGYFDYNS